MSDMGKWLIFFGLVIVTAGIILVFAGKIPWLGKLPGDFYVKRENFTLYFPIATCLLLSVLLSFILWLFRR